MSTDPTVLTEGASGLDSIKEIMDAFDPAVLLPALDTVIGRVDLICRIAVMVGPIVILLLGLSYFFIAPKEATHSFGYRCYFGMGSVEAWRFTQKLAGLVLGALGLVLTLVMFFVVIGFGGLEMMELVGRAAVCMIWEAALTIVACLGIHITAAVKFDRNGDLRKR